MANTVHVPEILHAVRRVGIDLSYIHWTMEATDTPVARHGQNGVAVHEFGACEDGSHRICCTKKATPLLGSGYPG